MIEISWTSGSLDEARSVARKLVENKLVACAQITPWIESLYLWNQKLEIGQESKVVFKTAEDKFEEVKRTILEEAKYDVPEITYVRVVGGNSAYLEWVEESVR